MRRLLVLIGVLAALAGPCAAAPVVDGAASGHCGGCTSTTATLTTLDTNDAIVVVVSYNNDALTCSAPPTAAGLTFTKRKQQAFTGVTYHIGLEEWAAPSAAALSSEVITATSTCTSDTLNIVAFGVNGALSYTAPWDSNGALPAVTTGTGPTASPTFSTSQTNDLVIVSTFVVNTNGNLANGVLWNGIANIFNTSGGPNSHAEAQDQAFAGAQSATTVAMTIQAASDAITLIDAIAGAPIGACSLAATGAGAC